MSRPYHHGDLRRTLVDETLQMVDADGAEAFSLRSVAAATGVSPMAVYRHFANREELLRATAAVALEQFGADLEAGLDGSNSVADRARALLLGYLDAAIASPGRFRLMFGPAGAGHPDGVLDAPPDGPRPQRLFVALASEQLAAHPGVELDPITLAATSWASIHGLATLVIDGPLEVEFARDLARRLADQPPLPAGT